MSAALTKIAIEILAPLLTTVVTAAIGWVGVKVAGFFHAKTEAIADERTRAVVDAAFDRLHGAVVAAVKDVASTTVEAAKKDAADGKLPTEVARDARDAAIAKAKAIAGTQALAALEAAGVDLEHALGSSVEAAVAEHKSGELPSFIASALTRIRQTTPTP